MNSKNQLSRRPDERNKDAIASNLRVTAKGGGIIVLGRLVEYGLRFVIAFLLARLLGAEQYGVYILALSVATLTSGISKFGMDSTLVRYIAIKRSENDEKGLWGTIQIAILSSTLLSLMCALALNLFASSIAINIFHEPQLTPLLKLFSIIVPFLTLSDVLVGASRGFKKMEYSVIAENFIMMFVRMILIGIIALIKITPFKAAIAFGISDLASSVALIFFINKEFRLKRPLRTAHYDLRGILRFSVPFWISGLLTKFRKYISIFFLGFLFTVEGVGVFSLIGRISLIGRMTFIAIETSIKPIIAELYNKGDIKQIGQLYQITSRWALTINIPIFLVMILFPKTLLSIFGYAFVEGAIALTILAYSDILDISTGICGTIIDMTGYTKLKMFNSIVRVIILVSSNLILIPRWGLVGAAIASLLGISVLNIMRMAQVWIIFKLLPYNRDFVKPIFAGIISIVITWLVIQRFPPKNNLLIAGVEGILGWISYFVLIFVLGISSEEQAILSEIKIRLISFIAQSRSALRRLLSKGAIKQKYQ